MKLIINVFTLLAFSTLLAEVPKDCTKRIAASDTVNLANRLSLDAVNPVNLRDPNSLFSKHVQYMNEKLNTKEILMTGPLRNTSGVVLEGFTVLATNNIEVAKKIIEADPFVIENIVNIKYKVWEICKD